MDTSDCITEDSVI